MTEDLGQRNKIVLIIGQELMRHHVTKQMRVKLESANGTVLVAQVPHATISQWSTLADEYLF